MILLRCVYKSTFFWFTDLDNFTLYTNDVLGSNEDVRENTSLRISCHIDGNPAPKIRLSRGQVDTELIERQGSWLNYTINPAQCSDTDTYTCRGTSTRFNTVERIFNISIFCMNHAVLLMKAKLVLFNETKKSKWLRKEDF